MIKKTLISTALALAFATSVSADEVKNEVKNDGYNYLEIGAVSVGRILTEESQTALDSVSLSEFGYSASLGFRKFNEEKAGYSYAINYTKADEFESFGASVRYIALIDDKNVFLEIGPSLSYQKVNDFNDDAQFGLGVYTALNANLNSFGLPVSDKFGAKLYTNVNLGTYGNKGAIETKKLGGLDAGFALEYRL